MKTVQRQPSEAKAFAFRYIPGTHFPLGAFLASGQLFASQFPTRTHPIRTTTVSVSAVAGASSISLTDDVGRGARLIFGTGATHETNKVLSINGTGPYVALLLDPLRYAHPAAELLRYELGLTLVVLSSAEATIVETDDYIDAAVPFWHGVDGEEYRISIFATLNDGQTTEDECRVWVRDV